ncbi:MAG: hypothetical protein M1826_007311 [Phylliscum demangeonii]|nr:MAG: hypothetical protein M1826_007311 [Phylliscum demangeonii]
MPRRGERLPDHLLSQHPASVARRAHERGLTGHPLAVHRAARADRSAKARALRRVRRMPEYGASSAAVRRQAEALTEASLMGRRWVEHRSADWVRDHGHDDDDDDDDDDHLTEDDHEPAADPTEAVAAVGVQPAAAPELVAPLVLAGAGAGVVAGAAPAGAASGAGGVVAGAGGVVAGAGPLSPPPPPSPPRPQGVEGDEQAEDGTVPVVHWG